MILDIVNFNVILDLIKYLEVILLFSSLAYYIMLLRKEFASYCNSILQELGLTQGLLFFILYIGTHPGCSPTQLSTALHMDAGHAARSLNKLEQGEFISQEANPSDRRSHILQLREKGESAFFISHELFTNWDREKMADMPEDERKALLQLLKGLLPADGEPALSLNPSCSQEETDHV